MHEYPKKTKRPQLFSQLNLTRPVPINKRRSEPFVPTKSIGGGKKKDWLHLRKKPARADIRRRAHACFKPRQGSEIGGKEKSISWSFGGNQIRKGGGNRTRASRESN